MILWGRSQVGIVGMASPCSVVSGTAAGLAWMVGGARGSLPLHVALHMIDVSSLIAKAVGAE